MPRGIYVRTEEQKRKMSKAITGIKRSEETKRKISDANKGENNPMYGKHHTKQSKQKIGNAHMGKFGDESMNWKGDNVGITAIHIRVRNIKSIPSICDICHQKTDKNGKTKLELSNIRNHQYTDDPDDYQYVHHGCHMKYDNKNKE